jgi:hypothetical protein
MLEVGRTRDEIPMELLDFFKIHNTYSHTVALRVTQAVTKTSTKNIPGEGGRLCPHRNL